MFKTRPKHNIYINGDCLEYMKMMPDNYIDVVIADPPYGIGASKMVMGSGKNKQYSNTKEWDKKIPSNEYFAELFRISKDQIIFGGNYFNLPISRGWIFWDKGINGDSSFADGELMWSSFDRVLRIAPIRYKGFLGAEENRFHITQKPKKLYRWIAKNYLNEGDLILDPFVGSANSLAVYEELGFQYVGFEKDADYYNDSLKNIAQHKAFFKSRSKEEINRSPQISIFDDI